MTTVAGIYCRSAPDAGVGVAVALVAGSRLVDQLYRHAAGPVAAAFFEELRLCGGELFGRYRPARVVLWQLAPTVSGVAGGLRAASAGVRSEGALLCAAAGSGLHVDVAERDDLLSRTRAGRVGAAVDELTRGLDPQPAEPSVRYAAAMALAST